MTPHSHKAALESTAQLFAVSVLLVGLGLFTRGVWLAWRPAGWMVAGLFVATPAFLWLYRSIRKQLHEGRR